MAGTACAGRSGRHLHKWHRSRRPARECVRVDRGRSTSAGEHRFGRSHARHARAGHGSSSSSAATGARSGPPACAGSTRSLCAGRFRFASATRRRPTVKVNDADGNPIEIAAVVVWQVRDSARATYGVEDFVAFVNTQSEAALRHVPTVTPTTTAAATPHRCATTRTRSPNSWQTRSRPVSSLPGSTSSRPGSPGSPTPRRSPRSCCSASKPTRS